MTPNDLAADLRRIAAALPREIAESERGVAEDACRTLARLVEGGNGRAMIEDYLRRNHPDLSVDAVLREIQAGWRTKAQPRTNSSVGTAITNESAFACALAESPDHPFWQEAMREIAEARRQRLNQAISRVLRG